VRTAYGYGVGIKVVGNNKIEVVADVHSHRDREFLHKIRDRVSQWYSAIAAVNALVEMGYSNVSLRKEGEDILVLAEEGFPSW
jgi:hypothetical protein